METGQQNHYDPSRSDPSFNDVFGAALPPITVASGGKVWRFGFPTQEAKAMYERYLIEEEKELIKGQQELGRSPAEIEARWDALTQQVKGKAFAVGGFLWVKYSGGPKGWLLWVKSLLAAHHPDVTTEQVAQLVSESGADVKLAVTTVIPPFFAWVLDQADRLAGSPGMERLKPEVVKIRAQMPAILARLTHS